MLATDTASATTWWAVPVVAGLFAVAAALVTLAINYFNDRQDRRRKLYADAFAAVAAYWEYPYAIRRRNHSEPAAERTRISDQFRDVQIGVAFHQAWIKTENKRVGKAYEELVATTRSVMGAQAKTAWEASPITADAEMNLGDKITREGLPEAEDTYLTAVRDHLSLWPAFLRRFGRSALSRERDSE